MNRKVHCNGMGIVELLKILDFSVVELWVDGGYGRQYSFVWSSYRTFGNKALRKRNLDILSKRMKQSEEGRRLSRYGRASQEESCGSIVKKEKSQCNLDNDCFDYSFLLDYESLRDARMHQVSEDEDHHTAKQSLVASLFIRSGTPSRYNASKKKKKAKNYRCNAQ
ncbi:unnamed protein product [Prunus armeniaca]|uniref:Uncharacterized protein n=1 Tax=Prunus armeniaca TaxID=36596 RepID=A0A6J5XWG2_PRUAR|nr:unnamed protein product [Prunus armeniaca]